MRCLLLSTTMLAAPDGRGSASVPDVILNESQAAEATGLSTRTLQRLRLEGGGAPYVRLTPGRIGYSRRALEGWIASRTFASTSAETAATAREARS
ncbi:helix-turn-helix transcriptional regulator [Roseococcus sp.]|uniref:helix-turn-helix transcriptional regulator n=1 Tax=Roseococcus sp. TaxID=2109646 RepID=UPI003BA8E5E7